MNLIFVSSPQSEFEIERKEICYFILTDPYLKQYFDVFLFENLPACEQNPQYNYREKVEESEIYLGLFGASYGTPDGHGISATEYEFDYSTELDKHRIVYLKLLHGSVQPEKKMTLLINKAKASLTYTTFSSIDELKLKVMQSLLYYQQYYSKTKGPSDE